MSLLPYVLYIICIEVHPFNSRLYSFFNTLLLSCRVRWPEIQSESNSCSCAQTTREKQSIVGPLNQPPPQVSTYWWMLVFSAFRRSVSLWDKIYLTIIIKSVLLHLYAIIILLYLHCKIGLTASLSARKSKCNQSMGSDIYFSRGDPLRPTSLL